MSGHHAIKGSVRPTKALQSQANDHCVCGCNVFVVYLEVAAVQVLEFGLSDEVAVSTSIPLLAEK